MFDREQWHEIMVVLGRNKLRTFLTAFGVFWGIFMLVIMMGSGQGLQNGAASMFGGTATNSMFLWTNNTTIPYKGFKKDRSYNFRNGDIAALKAAVPGLNKLAPRCQAGGHRGAANVTRGIKTGAFQVSGDYPEFINIQHYDIIEGRFINDDDLEHKRKVCVIGIEVFNALYDAGEQAIGSYIKAQGINYKVVGLIESSSDDADRSEQEDKTVVIPLTTFQRAYGWGDVVGWFSFTSKPGVSVKEVGEDIKAVLRQRHKIHPEDDRAFGSFNLEERYNQVMGLLTGISILSLVVGTLTLLAGAIGVSNIVLVIVKERTKEFGIRRALGATPFDVMKQVILESVTLTVLSGIIGIIAGVWSLEMLSSILNSSAGEVGMFRNPGVKLEIVLISLGILIVSGLFAGFIPARKAVSIKPVEALHYE